MHPPAIEDKVMNEEKMIDKATHLDNLVRVCYDVDREILAWLWRIWRHLDRLDFDNISIRS